MTRFTLRARFRDTALEVSLLGQGAMPAFPGSLRERCEELTRALALSLSADGLDEDVRNEVVYAQCALLDEAALSHIDGTERAEWENNPMQLARFGTNDAGERVFDRLKARMDEPAPCIDLLECYATVLCLGFKGRYARDGELARQAIIERLETMVASHRPSTDDVFVVDMSGGRRWRGLSALTTAALSFMMAVAVYVLCRQSLHQSLMLLAPSGTP